MTDKTDNNSADNKLINSAEIKTDTKLNNKKSDIQSVAKSNNNLSDNNSNSNIDNKSDSDINTDKYETKSVSDKKTDNDNNTLAAEIKAELRKENKMTDHQSEEYIEDMLPDKKAEDADIARVILAVLFVALLFGLFIADRQAEENDHYIITDTPSAVEGKAKEFKPFFVQGRNPEPELNLPKVKNPDKNMKMKEAEINSEDL